jgi:hypothetical protein
MDLFRSRFQVNVVGFSGLNLTVQHKHPGHDILYNKVGKGECKSNWHVMVLRYTLPHIQHMPKGSSILNKINVKDISQEVKPMPKLSNQKIAKASYSTDIPFSVNTNKQSVK